MQKFLFFLIITIIPVFAYEVYSPKTFEYEKSSENLLFVVDFSNSMSDYIGNFKKSDMVKSVLNRILPQIPPETKTGLRVYGHTCNPLALNACRSSELKVPVKENNGTNISSALEKLRPRGMTPITYSLKQAVKRDFIDMKGSKHIILLTDGGENCDESPCEYAISLVQSRRDVMIDVIAFDVNDSDDLAQLKCTADVTGGRFIEAYTNAQLLKSMDELLIPHKQVEALILQKD